MPTELIELGLLITIIVLLECMGDDLSDEK